MHRTKIGSVAAVAAAAFLLVGSSVSAQSSPAAGGGLKIGVVTDVGQLDDKSFNQFSNAGAVDAATQLGGTHDVIITKEVADYAQNIGTFVDNHYDVIVTIGFLIGSDTIKAAKANPNIHFIGVDQGICVDENGDNDPNFKCAGDPSKLIPNYQGVSFAEGQPGYLAGIVAGTLSKSGIIGAVGGTNLPAVVRYRDGYINGAKSVNPAIQVLYVETDPNPTIGFNSPEKGASEATTMLDAGADVIFQIAGGTGVGALQTTCAAGKYGIGVDVDQANSLPANAASCVVTSAEKKLQDTVKSVILSVADNTFKGGNVTYDAASTPPAIGYSAFHNHEDLLTADLKGKLDAATAAMIGGTLNPLATPAP